MTVLLVFIAYVVGAAISVLGLCYLNSRFRVINEFDFSTAVIVSAAIWPIGFPVAGAYIVGQGIFNGDD